VLFANPLTTGTATPGMAAPIAAPVVVASVKSFSSGLITSPAAAPTAPVTPPPNNR